MGTWGPGPLENDAALDLIAEASEAPEPAAVVTAALAAVDASDPADAEDSARLVAAAHLLARSKQRERDATADEDPAVEELDRVLADCFSDDVYAVAIAALDRLVESSELSELWKEAGGEAAATWRASIATLRARLAS